MCPSRFRLRRIFRGPIQTVSKPLIKWGISPNSVTYLSLLFAFAAFLSLIIFHNQLAYGILVFLTGFFDGVDGAVARGSGKQSVNGAFTDSFVDKISEALLIFAIPLSFPEDSLFGLSLYSWAYVCFSAWLLTSYARSRAESVGVEDLDVGLGGRSERLFTLCVFSILSLIGMGLFVVTLLGIGTSLYRFHHYRQQISTIS